MPPAHDYQQHRQCPLCHTPLQGPTSGSRCLVSGEEDRRKTFGLRNGSRKQHERKKGGRSSCLVSLVSGHPASSFMCQCSTPPHTQVSPSLLEGGRELAPSRYPSYRFGGWRAAQQGTAGCPHTPPHSELGLSRSSLLKEVERAGGMVR